MVTTRAQTAPRPLALLEALLTTNASMVDRLLQGSGAAQLSHVGPAGLTLHAAVATRRTDLLPALVAAGAPLDHALDLNAFESGADQLKQMLLKAPPRIRSELDEVPRGATALALAARWAQAAVHGRDLFHTCLP